MKGLVFKDLLLMKKMNKKVTKNRCFLRKQFLPAVPAGKKTHPARCVRRRMRFHPLARARKV